MAKALQFALSLPSRIVPGSTTKLMTLQKQSTNTLQQCLSKFSGNLTNTPRAHCHSTLSAIRSMHHSKSKGCRCFACSKKQNYFYSTEVDKEISKFLEKEIQYENSRSNPTLPKVPGFEISTDGGDVTLTKATGSEKVVVRLSVNDAVDSIMSENEPEKQDEPPQMVCRPPFEVEISKGDGPILALQCAFPSQDQVFEDGSQFQKGGQESEQIDDQFEIQEVAIHVGEWKDTTFSVSAATMDAELFDLLMDMLDERGINDEFIVNLVDYCTAYENKQYVNFLQGLKSFAEK